MKINQYYNNNILEKTIIHKINFIDKLKIIITGRLVITYPLLKPENIKHEKINN